MDQLNVKQEKPLIKKYKELIVFEWNKQTKRNGNNEEVIIVKKLNNKLN